jgi:hypothetical protein
MACNLSQLAKAMKYSRQHVNRLAHEPGFPYLRKPGKDGSTRWEVDPGQVRRWLEARDLAAHERQQERERLAEIEMAYRRFWTEALRRGYKPEDIAYIRNRCDGIEALRAKARRMRIEI